MFEKKLIDLVRGIRNHKKTESHYINQAIQEIKVELRGNNYELKSQAVLKLTYLLMLGYDMQWAAFNVVEVMSQQRFDYKRIGYLGANLSFDETTEVAMLCPQLLRKDMVGHPFEAGCALNCLSNIMTRDLGEDLAADLVALLNTQRPYIRKKAILTLYKLFLKYPEALRPAWPRLKEKLDDPEIEVVTATVTVICELARKNATNYVSLSPVLFKLLNNTSNTNWCLIKIVKLFGHLLPAEKRLVKKLIEPITNIINTTPAVSLLYECIRTSIIGMSDQLPLMKLCISKLHTFIESTDQNLKYLGLQALYSILKVHPKAVAEHRDMVVSCLDDPDVNIRMRALDLVTGMVSKKNLVEIVQKLILKLNSAEGLWRDDLVEKIIYMCSNNNYALVRDFEWYLGVLSELTSVKGTCHGPLIGSQFMDVTIRVKVVRKYSVSLLTQLLRDGRLLKDSEHEPSMLSVLAGAAWIIGEFVEYTRQVEEIILCLLQPRTTTLPNHVQCVYLQTLLKLFAHLLKNYQRATILQNHQPQNNSSDIDQPQDDEEEESPEDKKVVMEGLFKQVHERIPPFLHSTDLEVQERSCFFYEIVKYIESECFKKQSASLPVEELCSLFAEPLHPVAPNVQAKVPIPEGLDLEQEINQPPSEDESSSSEEEPNEEETQYETEIFLNIKRPANKSNESSTMEESERKAYILQNPTKKSISTPEQAEEHILGSSFKKTKANQKQKKQKVKRPQVDPTYDGADLVSRKGLSSSQSSIHSSSQDPLASVDLNSELRPNETLVFKTHRVVQAPPSSTNQGEKKKKGTEQESKETQKTKTKSKKTPKKNLKAKKKKGSQHAGDIDPRDQVAHHEQNDSGLNDVSSLGENPYATQSFQNATNLATSISNSDSTTYSLSSSSLSLSNISFPSIPLPNVSIPTPNLAAITETFSSYSNISEGNAPSSGPISPLFHKQDLSVEESPTTEKKKKKKEVHKVGKKGKKSKDGTKNKAQTESETPTETTKEKSKEARLKNKSGAGPRRVAKPETIVPKHQTLFNDNNVKAVYEYQTNQSIHQHQRLTVAITVTNSSPQTLQVVITIEGTVDNLKLLGSPNPVSLVSGGSTVTYMTLQIQTRSVEPLLVHASLSYNGLPSSAAVTFLFPSSLFLVPVTIDREELQTIITERASKGELFSKASTIKLSQGETLQHSIILLCSLLNMTIVERDRQAACLYSRFGEKKGAEDSSSTHDVCLLVKQKNVSTMSIELKVSDATLCESLLKETKEFFDQRLVS